jgi:type I restriction enzyme S subunit
MNSEGLVVTGNKSSPLGPLPSGWKIVPLKDVSFFITKGSTPTTYGFEWMNDGVPFLRSECVTDGGFINDGLSYISEEANYFLKRSEIRAGDMLITITGNVGRVIIYPASMRPGNINQHIARIRIVDADELNATYISYVLSSQSYRDYYLRITTGLAYPQISLEQIRHSEIPAPPLPQQQKIAKILTTVDNLIEQTQALIDKYTAIKQGMMGDLFTRGIDLSGTPETNPNHGQLRPSFEEAPELYKETELGWVPRQWSTVSLGEIADKITSGSRDWAAYYADNGDLFVRISNLTREHINFRWDSVKYVDIGGGSEGERTRLLEGDILISITADLGIVGVVPKGFERAYINQHTALVRLGSQCNPRFIGNYLSSHMGQIQFEKYNDTGAKAGLNLPTIASLKCVFPSLNEQDEISKIIDALDSKVSIQKVERSKHEMIKKGLMQDLLTGKVQVTA